MSTSNKGRHRARKRVASTPTRVGSVTVAMSAVALAAVTAAPGSAVAAGVIKQSCAAGSGQALSNVNCVGSTASPVGALVQSALPADLSAILKILNIDLNGSAVVVLGDGTATIQGTGFALAGQGLSSKLLGTPGGTVTANAVTPLSGAVAIGTGKGNASATAVSGVAVAASGSGSATAVSVGGVATAINILGMKNVTCTALYGKASADGVGSCTSVLYIFTAKNAAGSDVWTFAIADPTSFTLGGDGALPIPHFARDIVRVSVGGPAGVTVGTDLFTLPSTSKNAVSLSSSAATKSVSKAVAAPTVTSQASPTVSSTADKSAVMDSGVAQSVSDTSTSDTPSDAGSPHSSSMSLLPSVGKHRKGNSTSGSDFGLRSEMSAADGSKAQSTGPAAHSTGVATQSTGVATQPAKLAGASDSDSD